MVREINLPGCGLAPAPNHALATVWAGALGKRGRCEQRDCQSCARSTHPRRITTALALPISSASPAARRRSLLHLDTQLAHPPSIQPHLLPPEPPLLTLFSNPNTSKMPPKAQKTPTTGGKAPAGKAPAEKKEAGKKTAAPSGEKKKRTKTRKETYSSYIYKGMFNSTWQQSLLRASHFVCRVVSSLPSLPFLPHLSAGLNGLI